MDTPYLVDTDVLIDFLRGYEKAVTFISDHSSRIILPAISVAELYAGVKGDHELSVLDHFVSLFPVIPVTSDIAKAGGLYKRDFGKSHGIGLADAIIAAIRDENHAELKTLNVKHFPMFQDLKPAYTK